MLLCMKSTKEITLDDLDPDDIINSRKWRVLHMLPEKDSAGRKVICFIPKLKVIRTTPDNVSDSSLVSKNNSSSFLFSVASQ